MRGLIIGAGEVGNSLMEVLSKEYETDLWDIRYVGKIPTSAEILHICFPYCDDFIEQVKTYKDIIKPKHIVIHSTVPIGTCSDLECVHSPIVGIHPHLEKSLKTFIKFLGGCGASGVANYFRRAGMKVYVTDKSETTELCKIQSTNFYALCIEFFKDMKNQCTKQGVPFEFWTLWNQNYNTGYNQLGYSEYTRPNLIPIMTKQGGHCTLPNLEFLDSEFTRFLKEVTLPKSI